MSSSDPVASQGQPSPDENQTPFERFEDLVRKVVLVPKTETTEIDKKQRGRYRPA